MENSVLAANKTGREELISRSNERNHFFGKITKNKSGYFIRELLSDMILPLKFIEYEIPPGNDEFLKTFYFRLINRADKQKLAAELIEKRFIGINEDMHYHLHHGTMFDGEVEHINQKYISVFIPFFSEHARIDTNNCQEELKKKYSTLKEGDRLRLKLIRIDGKIMYVKIDGYTFWQPRRIHKHGRG